MVNKEYPLRFYRFTKYGGVGLALTKRYASTPEILEIWFWYGRQLKMMSYSLPPKDYYYYGHYQTGESIPQPERSLFRNCPDLFPSVPYQKPQ
jgi:hypothetical protein